MKKTLTAVAILLCVATAQADLIVDAGNWNLLPDQPNQMVLVMISGQGSVTNATLLAEITGLSPLPVFNGGDIITGTIFAANNTGAPSYDFSWPQMAYLDIATDSGTVEGNGVLARLLVDTTGISEGSFGLLLTATQWGDSAVGTDPHADLTFIDGQINIAPEPTSMGLVALGLLAVIRRRR